MCYEYQALQAQGLISPEQLNTLGQQGWMLLQIIQHTADQYIIYLMRACIS